MSDTFLQAALQGVNGSIRLNHHVIDLSVPAGQQHAIEIALPHGRPEQIEAASERVGKRERDVHDPVEERDLLEAPTLDRLEACEQRP